jgi:hypothetical protein
VTEVFLTLTEVFPCFFLSCKANARVELTKTGHGPYSFTLVVICVVWLLFVLFGCYLCCSMCCLCVNVYCHRVTTQLQLTNISISISIVPELTEFVISQNMCRSDFTRRHSTPESFFVLQRNLDINCRGILGSPISVVKVVYISI